MAQGTGKQQPLYRQVAADLRARIEGGEWDAGDQLPTKPELVGHYNVSGGTLDSAIGELRDLGLVETRQGAGMFVIKLAAGPSSEYEAVMGRVDELAEEVKQLRGEVAAMRRSRAAAK
jgi:DNA-binding GntR family transcriptional regulator